MPYPDKINNLVDVTGDQTLAAGGHAARHNDVNEALQELADVLTVPAADTLAFAPDGSTERVRINSVGNVGIGTGTPQANLEISGQAAADGSDPVTLRISDKLNSSGWTDGAESTALEFYSGDTSTAGATVRGKISMVQSGTAAVNSFMTFHTKPGTGSLAEVMRIHANGAVLVGTTSEGSASAGDLVVNGGVFLGGSAAANELDDYEEGTFTPTYTTNGTDFSSITYDPNTFGYYTKIGSLVYVHGFIRTDALTVGSASGIVAIGGLPFTVANLSGAGNAGSVMIGFANNFSGDVPIEGYFLQNNAYLLLWYRVASNLASAGLAPADMGTGTNNNQVYFSGYYRA